MKCKVYKCFKRARRRLWYVVKVSVVNLRRLCDSVSLGKGSRQTADQLSFQVPATDCAAGFRLSVNDLITRSTAWRRTVCVYRMLMMIYYCLNRCQIVACIGCWRGDGSPALWSAFIRVTRCGVSDSFGNIGRLSEVGYWTGQGTLSFHPCKHHV